MTNDHTKQHQHPRHYLLGAVRPRWMIILLSGAFLCASLNFLIYFHIAGTSLLAIPTTNDSTRSVSSNDPRAKNMETTALPTNDEPAVLVVATRFHLGKAAAPPSQDDLQSKVRSFANFCSNCGVVVEPIDSTTSASSHRVVGVMAVDAEERIAGYNLVAQMEEALAAVLLHHPSTTVAIPPLHILPVQPWGEFAPALNALIRWAGRVPVAAATAATTTAATQILFCSAETTASAVAVAALRRHLMIDTDTLVVGLALPGHDYARGRHRLLNGRTTPWNTLALWNWRLLALTGFPLVAEGLVHDDDDDNNSNNSMAGVEEVVTIAILQRLLGAEHAQAKLVQLEEEDGASSSGGVVWDQTFGGDPARQQWHEHKMRSKESRAARQLKLLGGLTGTVHHC